MANAEWEADEARYEVEPDEQLERSAYSGTVHARPIYLGSGHSEFPCGLDGGAAVLVAAHDDEVTCAGCAADVRTRRAHGIPAPLLSAVVHALSKRVDARDGFVSNAMLHAPCGAQWPLALVGSPAWRESADVDAVTCPGCLAARGAA